MMLYFCNFCFVFSYVILTCLSIQTSSAQKRISDLNEEADGPNALTSDEIYANSHPWQDLYPNVLKRTSSADDFTSWKNADIPKRNTDTVPPPGFVGVRGRRAECKCPPEPKIKRGDGVFKNIDSFLPFFRGHKTWIMALRKPSGKKDNVVYKDGFLGVRG